MNAEFCEIVCSAWGYMGGSMVACSSKILQIIVVNGVNFQAKKKKEEKRGIIYAGRRDRSGIVLKHE